MTHYVPFKHWHDADKRYVDVNWATEDINVYNRAMQIIASGYHFESDISDTGKFVASINANDGSYVYTVIPMANSLVADDSRITNMINNFDTEGEEE